MFLERKANQLGVYIHFPFCIQKCHYCDFYSLEILENSKLEILEVFIKRLKEEIRERYSYFENFKIINTIYFGGGTSSFLKPEMLNEILEYLHNFFEFDKKCEITLEGNPEHFYNENYVKELRDIGINRINCGFQTLHFKFHQQMNRFYNEEHYFQLLENLSKNFYNFGIDLIYGFPGQTLDDFYEDLQYVMKYPLKHLSVYSLTVEKGTPYETLIKNKILQEPNTELQDSIFENLPLLLNKYNFQHYEVSNFALEQFECRHNLRYWLYEPYLGLGPSAHGFNGKFRYNNVKNWQKWINKYSYNYELHDPLKEIPVTMLRILYPINLNWFYEITEKFDIFINFLNRMEDNELGILFSIDNIPYFKWNYKGISQLDNIIIDFYESLEKIYI